MHAGSNLVGYDKLEGIDPEVAIPRAFPRSQLPTFIHQSATNRQRRGNGKNWDKAVTKVVRGDQRDRIEADTRSVGLKTTNARMWQPLKRR